MRMVDFPYFLYYRFKYSREVNPVRSGTNTTILSSRLLLFLDVTLSMFLIFSATSNGVNKPERAFSYDGITKHRDNCTR